MFNCLKTVLATWANSYIDVTSLWHDKPNSYEKSRWISSVKLLSENLSQWASPQQWQQHRKIGNWYHPKVGLTVYFRRIFLHVTCRSKMWIPVRCSEMKVLRRINHLRTETFSTSDFLVVYLWYVRVLNYSSKCKTIRQYQWNTMLPTIT
jgi:hypothetical protein